MDQIILSTGIFCEVPVSFFIAYREGKPVYVDFPDADISGRVYAGRIERISEQPAGAFVQLERGRTGFLKRQYFADLTFVSQRESIDRNRHPLIDGDRVLVYVGSEGKSGKKPILLPFKSDSITRADCLAALEQGDTYRLLESSRIDQIAQEYGLKNPDVCDARGDLKLQRELTMIHKTDSLISELLSRRVWLKSGSNILIEEGETAVLIDVNTAKSCGGKEKHPEVNKEAFEAALEQIRLRHLSGMILIDFLKMDASEREDFSGYLRKKTADNREIFFHDLTALGLGEFTVPFRQPSLSRKIVEIKKNYHKNSISGVDESNFV